LTGKKKKPTGWQENMAFKVFADTNVFLDALLERGTDWLNAEEIMELSATNRIDLFTSASNLVNVIYILQKQRLTPNEVILSGELILSYTNLVDISKQSFRNAMRAGFSDLEDAIQYHTALQVKEIDFFITSDVKGYKKALPQLPVILPKQFMALYRKMKG
jgi:predicted nucleic acid-binding protein